MPARSTVSRLPPEVQEEIDRRLIDGGFADYTALTEWLAGQGFEISRSALHRHGSALERRIEQVRIASEQAKAIEKAATDSGESIAFSIVVQLQVKLHEIVMAVEAGDAKSACTLARALGDLVRAGISLRRERRQALAEAADAADTAARRAGLSTDTAAAIRAAIEGLEQAA